MPDIVYGTVDGHELKLDLYMPAEAVNPPLLIYVHGGAWRGGSKERVLTTTFVEDGYAMASVEFRLSGDAMFPAQIHDIKAAIRFLRGNAHSYGYEATRIGILGSSSGGHLVELVGVTNGHEELEGKVGDYLDQSSDIQAIVSYFGASNLTTILKQSTPHGLSVRVPALDLLIGGQPEDKVELARLASPVFHVDATDPPLLMLHGDQDPQMPINQSHELHNAYKEYDLQVQFEVVHGAAHGGEQFRDEKRIELVETFLDNQLR
jgi:acetyl esterase/lipase